MVPMTAACPSHGLPPPCTCAVVVTFNRRALLQRCLVALDAQSTQLHAVVVIDNASTDGTSEWLAEHHPDLDLVRCRRNVGGAGGFAVGLERALESHRADWVWLLDDDTMASPEALEQLLAVAVAVDQPPSFLASRVEWTDGRAHPMNTPRPLPWVRAGATCPERTRPLRSASFVSLLVRASAARRTDGPIAAYFLWNDDFEYTLRLARQTPGLLVEDSVVTHLTAHAGDSDVASPDRFFFEVRNKIWLLTRSAALRPWERPLYAAATASRWVRTWQRSQERPALLSAGARGLREGLSRAPRANGLILAKLT